MLDKTVAIKEGRTSLGIEFGSTRVKAVLIGEDYSALAEGMYGWENSFIDGYWTYGKDEIITALQSCFASLKDDVKNRYGVTLSTIGSIGISAMMHGYLALGSDGDFLAPFRTWRNTTTGESAKALTELFSFNIPERWSIAHLYQAILNNEEHVRDIAYLTTLAGYIHYRLTGVKAVGIGEAAGMFPIDSEKLCYNKDMLDKFSELISGKNYPWCIEDILPSVLVAGDNAGYLTKDGALLLDPSGELQSGIPFCPAEGDAGTGMVATNSVREKSGNVSAGTSVFAMVVLEKPLSEVHPEIDLVTTPSGEAVAMVHCNNCTADIDSWARIFFDFAANYGIEADMGKVFELIYKTALEGENDCGGLLSFNYLSGESITHIKNGVPLFIRSKNSSLTFSNFARNLLYSSVCTLRIGMDILKNEGVKIDELYGHGGFFKTPVAGQSIMADALDVPVTVMETANVGGPWGMALLASYMINGKKEMSLADFLSGRVFLNSKKTPLAPEKQAADGFNRYLNEYKKALAVEAKADEILY